MSRSIKISITPAGVPTVEAFGFTGGSCSNATKPITDALSNGKGNDVVIEKPEMHQADFGQMENQQFQGV